MWQGIIPAVTTKFTLDDQLDHAEMERCFALMMEAGCHGLIACGTLGEGNMLDHDERLAVLARAKAGADGLMIVPSPLYHTNPRETVANLRAIASAGDLPVMIYSNRIGYRVDVTPDIMEELADDARFVAIKESSDDIRRTTEIFNQLGNRYNVLTGVDNLGLEALLMGAVGWVAGLVVAFPRENVAIWNLVQAGRIDEAREIYRWFRPLLDLDVSTFLVQQIKLAEALAIGSNERVRAPRLPLAGKHRARVQGVIRHAIATRPDLSKL